MAVAPKRSACAGGAKAKGDACVTPPSMLVTDGAFCRWILFPVQVPVNIKRLVWNAKKLFHIKSHGESDMSPTYVIRRVRELCDGLVTVTGDDALSVEAQANATLLFKILVIFCFTFSFFW